MAISLPLKLLDLPSYQFDTPDACTAELNLSLMPAGYLLALSNDTLQGRGVEKAAKLVKHLRNTIVYIEKLE